MLSWLSAPVPLFFHLNHLAMMVLTLFKVSLLPVSLSFLKTAFIDTVREVHLIDHAGD